MKKYADVIEIVNDNSAKVALYRHSKCSGCGKCNKDVHPGSLLLAKNPIGAQKMDRVCVKIKKELNIMEIFIMYILPTLLVFAGLWFGSFLVPFGAPDFLGLVFAAMLFILSLIIYMKTKHLYEPKFNSIIYKNLSRQ